MLTMGREVRLPAELVFGSTTPESLESVTNYGDYVDSIRTKLNRAHAIARTHLQKSARRSKEVYDKRMLMNDYLEGVVWCLAEARKIGEAPKLQPAYEGPCIVSKKLSPITFNIQLNVKGTQRVVHHNKLKPYQGCNVPRWIKKLKKQKRHE